MAINYSSPFVLCILISPDWWLRFQGWSNEGTLVECHNR
jgi:hypothetical protein